MEEKQKILEGSSRIFLFEGFYKTPMDEIAGQLKVSKKTIYKYFDSKETLIKEVVDNFLLKNKSIIQKIIDADNDAVTKSFKLFQHLGRLLLNLACLNRKGTALNDTLNFSGSGGLYSNQRPMP